MCPVRDGADRVSIRTPCKLNLFLEVTGKRPDGYHDLDMIMEAIDICDTIVVARDAPGIALTTDRPDIPTDRSNIIVKAAELFFAATGIAPRARFHLEKRVPVGGGLGGGSANGIGALFALMALYDAPLPDEEQFRIACALGSDVPFFLHGGLARCRGRGEIIAPLGSGAPRRFAVLVPPFGLGTAAVYASLEFPLTSPRRLGTISSRSVEERIRSGALFFNRLEDPAVKLRPELGALMRRAREVGVDAHLTGSGACLFAVVSSDFDRSHGGLVARALEGVAEVSIAGNLPAWG